MQRIANSTINISNICNLRVRIFIIGYKNIGESIVILFTDEYDNKNTVKYSIVIDSSSFKKRNITDDILRKYNVSTINLLCWTHPHVDHSKNLDLIVRKYCGASSKIILPEHFYNLPDDIVTITNKEEKEVIDKIFTLNRFTSNSTTPVSASSKGCNTIYKIDFADISRIIPVDLDIITPISSILGDYKKNQLKDIDINELSISLILTVDKYQFFFGGDTTNRHIDQTEQKYLEECRFVKIPHHASNTADHLPGYLADKIDTACSTKYKTRLPLSSILNEYKNKTDNIFLTGDNNNSSHNFGVIEYSYNFSGTDICVDVCLHGNAFKY